MKLYYIILFSFLVSTSAFSASCCGGGSSSSVIITGDNQQEMNISYSYRNDIGQTDTDGFSSLNNNSIIDRQYLYSASLANMFTDRFQSSLKVGITSKEINKQNRSENTTGLQDIELQSTYEFLPEYSYSIIRPRGFIYFKLDLPMSKSLYDSKSQVFSDVRGSGLVNNSLGLFLLKKSGDFSFKYAIEYQYYFGKQYSQFKLSDYHKFIIPFGINYSMPSLPIIFGVASTWNYQAPKKYTGALHSTSSAEYFWDLNFVTSYSITSNSNLALSYSDSSIIGKSVNSPLYRTVAINYNYGWPL